MLFTVWFSEQIDLYTCYIRRRKERLTHFERIEITRVCSQMMLILNPLLKIILGVVGPLFLFRNLVWTLPFC